MLPRWLKRLFLPKRRFEDVFHEAIRKLGGEASVTEIWREMAVIIDRYPNLGRLYVLVDDLEERRIVTTWSEPGGPERSFRPKRIVRLGAQPFSKDDA